MRQTTRMPTAEISVGELLSRGIAEVIDRQSLQKKLSLGRKLRVKFGIDPTAHDIHLGHAVPIRLLRRLQRLGHRVVFIVGDFTAMVGDPSGRTSARASLSFEQTRDFAKTYFDQAFRILDRNETEIHYNSEWLFSFDLTKTIELLSHASVSQLLAHETFRSRLKKERPFFAHELLYPMLQGYDSVAVKADIEVGALDQKFNLLMGREIQQAYGQPPQDIVMTEYLVGLDGKEKMSKTAGNYIALADEPAEMFGKVMSIPDKEILPYFTLATDVTDEAIVLIKRELKDKKNNPRDVKMRLAKQIVEELHGADAAEAAEDAWKTRFQRRGPASVDREVSVARGTHLLVDLLILIGLAKSKSEARRKIGEKAVKLFLGGEKLSPAEKIRVDRPLTVKLGKRFVRVVPK